MIRNVQKFIFHEFIRVYNFLNWHRQSIYAIIYYNSYVNLRGQKEPGYQYAFRDQ